MFRFEVGPDLNYSINKEHVANMGGGSPKGRAVAVIEKCRQRQLPVECMLSIEWVNTGKVSAGKISEAADKEARERASQTLAWAAGIIEKSEDDNPVISAAQMGPIIIMHTFLGDMYVEGPGGLQMRYHDLRAVKQGDPDWNPPRLSIKKTKTGQSWYAAGGGGILGCAGRPVWFKEPDEAQRAMDQFTIGNSEWQLIQG